MPSPKLLAISVPQRSPQAPEVPTIVELGVPGFDFAPAIGLLAPAGTPPAIVSRLNAVINESLKSDDMKATLAKFGSEAKITSPQEFTAFMAGETQKWSNVAKAAHVEIE